MDYESLIGKKVKFIFDDGVSNCVVVACVENIGITIIEDCIGGEYIACIHMPGSPDWNKQNESNKNDSPAVFDYLCTCINNGKDVYVNSLNRIEIELGADPDLYSASNFGPDGSMCAFQ